MRKALVIVAALALGQPVEAADWVFGLGGMDFNSPAANDAVSLTVERHGTPFWHLGRAAIGAGVSGVVSSEGDLWVGGGLSALMPVGQRGWFVEASVMPGLYLSDDVTDDLGSAFEIRSLAGFGFAAAENLRVSLAFTHTSNAGIGSHNPGVNALALRLRRTF